MDVTDDKKESSFGSTSKLLSENSNDSSKEVQSTMNETKSEDYRIRCTNGKALDKILHTAESTVQMMLSKSKLSESGREKALNMFTETFKNLMQENIAVNGLPWVPHKSFLSEDQLKIQENETASAILSKIGQLVEKSAFLRKQVPSSICKIDSRRYKHERHNLKTAKIIHQNFLPLVSDITSKLTDLKSQLLEIGEETEKNSQYADTQFKFMQQLEKDIEGAKDITLRMKAVLDACEL